jgi:hypothetical protein
LWQRLCRGNVPPRNQPRHESHNQVDRDVDELGQPLRNRPTVRLVLNDDPKGDMAKECQQQE